MDFNGLGASYYLFDPTNFGRIYIFVDFGNVRPWAKDLWQEENKFTLTNEIDIKKLADVCEWVSPERKFFYYGYYAEQPKLDKDHPLNIKYRNSIFRIDKATKSGFTTVQKEIKMVPHYDEAGKFIGKFPKCNFDVELTMDMLLKIEKYDTAVLFSGDSDFDKILGYLKNKGKKIIVACTRNRMSTELEEVSDKIIPVESLKSLLLFERKNNTPSLLAREE